MLFDKNGLNMCKIAYNGGDMSNRLEQGNMEPISL